MLSSCNDARHPRRREGHEASLPTREDWQRLAHGRSLRGTVIGFVIGVLPATGATIASFVAYIVEKKLAKDPSRFGKGAIEGVAGPEASNNAAASGAWCRCWRSACRDRARPR